MGRTPSVIQLALLALLSAACGGGQVEGGVQNEPNEPNEAQRIDPSVGGSTATGDPSPREDDPASDPGPESDPPAATGCPSTFAAAQRGGACANGPSECTYDEGSCYCGEPRRCSGAMQEPMPPAMQSWQCRATPPEVRPDGCPGRAPDEGSPCSIARPCGYGDCGGAVYGCVEGRWQVVDFVSPPP
ncbi:MAG: hypothetical protein DRJ42_13575 [Deltaproteobacteria bacterium]|nr:MAG: hypothetical protein DRJ42_13575 [Deltaproteobacteria bacterium]